MNNLESILTALVVDKKKLRCKTWEPNQYIWYWNKVVLDQDGSVFDIPLWLTLTKSTDWEVLGTLYFKDLKIGDKFRFSPNGEYERIKLSEDGTNYNICLKMNSNNKNIFFEKTIYNS